MKSELRKYLILIVELALIILFVVALIWFFRDVAHAETDTEMYVLCQPDSFLNVREFPKKTSNQIGYLMLGDKVTTDGVEKRGFLHIIGFGESGEGWVCKSYLVDNIPQVETVSAWINSKGRVAVRTYPNGPRSRWMRNGDELILYAASEDWSITNKGFVKTCYLECER